MEKFDEAAEFSQSHEVESPPGDIDMDMSESADARPDQEVEFEGTILTYLHWSYMVYIACPK